ncbi:MAG: hypothetical protein QM811_18110 [Pirellulales bacterium]
MLTIVCLAACLSISSASAKERRGDPIVRHEPLQPKSGVPVLVTAQLAKDAKNVVLRLQAVEPGQYVRKSDSAYEKTWTDLPLATTGQRATPRAATASSARACRPNTNAIADYCAIA